MSSTNDRIILTGCGWVTPFAVGSIADILTAAGAAGTREGSTETGETYWAVPDETSRSYPNLSKELQLNKGAWMAAIAIEHAYRTASLDRATLDATRVGLALGCGLAGQEGMITFANEVRRQSMRFVSPIHFPQTVGNYISAALSRGYDIRGPNVTLAGGAACGLEALIEARGLIADHQADIVLAGGVEHFFEPLVRGMEKSEVPFSDGACLFVVEGAEHAASRGAACLATFRHRQVAGFSEDGSNSGREPQQPQGRAGDSADHGVGIVSTAGCRKPGAVFVEHWVGQCLAAGGTAAVAAAIGAAEGHAVPRIELSSQDVVSEYRFHVDDLAGKDDTIQAVAVAGERGGHTVTLHLAIPRHPSHDDALKGVRDTFGLPVRSTQTGRIGLPDERRRDSHKTEPRP